MLSCKEALCVLAMKQNLIFPFLMKEIGLVADDLPKVKSKHPTKHHYSMHFLDEYLRMPLSSHGPFSFFHLRSR